MSIHPLAIVDPKASIGPGVEIGPFCVVERDVTIGEGCRLESHVVIKNGTSIGSGTLIMEGAVLGGFPQHINMPENPGRLVVGSGNTVRENATIHRAMEPENTTRIGDNNLVMGNVHIAHDCQIGNRTILTNNVMLAGHVIVEDRAFLSGAVGVHQFCRIGTLTMVGGQAHINKDILPYVTLHGLSSLVVGLNTVGLRRAGYDSGAIRQLKAAYRVIYRSGLSWNGILERLRTEFSEGPAAAFHRFCSTTKRGIVQERRLPPGATIKLPEKSEAEPAAQRKVG